MFTWVSAFGGIVATKLLADIDYVSQTYLPKYHKLLDDKRTRLGNLLATLRIPYTSPDAAFFLFVDLSLWLSNFDGDDDAKREMALLEYLMDHGVFLEPGKAFTSTFPGYFRLNYGVDETSFRLGMKRLATALEKLDGGKDSADVGEIMHRRQSPGHRLFACFTSDT